MNKNDNNLNFKPAIFLKKVNNSSKVIPLNITNNTLGPTRHFPVATKEWFNSIYAYNSNSIKSLSIADKNLSNLIKSYFNLYFSNKVLKSKRIATRFKRLAINKVFISKAELKHTSSKVVITLYVYNEERRALISKIKRLEAILFPSHSLLQKININRPYSLEENLNLIKIQEKSISLIEWLEELISSITEEIREEQVILSRTIKSNLITQRLLTVKSLEENIENIKSIITICQDHPSYYKCYDKFYREFLLNTTLEKEIMTIAYYKLLLNLNKFKFEDKFLLRLKPLITKIYNKEVEFNIVNLKTLYFNSDIFTQAISLKLKNRDNKLLNVLRSSLHMVKMPKVNRIREKSNKINLEELWANKVKNLNINSIFDKYHGNQDILNKLLLDLFPKSSFIEEEKENLSSSRNNKLLNIVLNTLKHKEMSGARLEAKGRLTRRFTASRSVFKIKWKGSLKNIDSSYRGLSSLLLRGHAKSNLQYSVVNSKTRNGSFGLKGWISSK